MEFGRLLHYCPNDIYNYQYLFFNDSYWMNENPCTHKLISRPTIKYKVIEYGDDIVQETDSEGHSTYYVNAEWKYVLQNYESSQERHN